MVKLEFEDMAGLIDYVEGVGGEADRDMNMLAAEHQSALRRDPSSKFRITLVMEVV